MLTQKPGVPLRRVSSMEIIFVEKGEYIVLRKFYFMLISVVDAKGPGLCKFCILHYIILLHLLKSPLVQTTQAIKGPSDTLSL